MWVLLQVLAVSAACLASLYFVYRAAIRGDPDLLSTSGRLHVKATFALSSAGWGGIFVLCANGVGPFHSSASGIAFAAAACLVVLNTASLLAKIWVRPVNKSWSFDLLTFDEAVPWFHALVAAGAVTALLLSPPNGWAIVSVLGVLFVLCVVHEVLFNIVPVLYLPPRATDEDHPRGDDDRE